MMAGAGASPYELASDAASRLGIAVGAEELATLASDLDLGDGGVSVNIIFTISTNAFSPIAPTRIHRIRQRGCAAFGA